MSIWISSTRREKKKKRLCLQNNRFELRGEQNFKPHISRWHKITWLDKSNIWPILNLLTTNHRLNSGDGIKIFY